MAPTKREELDWTNLESIKACVQGAKQSLSRNHTSASRMKKRKFTSSSVHEATRLRNELTESFNFLCAIYDRISALEPASATENEKSIADYQNKYEEACDWLAELVSKAESPTGEGPTHAATGDKRPTLDQLLKPDTLTCDHTPSQLRRWITEFTEFYHSGELSRCTKLQQQAYFYRCLDQRLKTAMESRINPHTEMFGTGGCIDQLEEEFRLLYPLFTRRVKYFQATPDLGENAVSYLDKLKLLSDEADIENLSKESVTIFRFLSSFHQGGNCKCGGCHKSTTTWRKETHLPAQAQGRPEG